MFFGKYVILEDEGINKVYKYNNNYYLEPSKYFDSVNIVYAFHDDLLSFFICDNSDVLIDDGFNIHKTSLHINTKYKKFLYIWCLDYYEDTRDNWLVSLDFEGYLWSWKLKIDINDNITLSKPVKMDINDFIFDIDQGLIYEDCDIILFAQNNEVYKYNLYTSSCENLHYSHDDKIKIALCRCKKNIEGNINILKISDYDYEFGITKENNILDIKNNNLINNNITSDKIDQIIRWGGGVYADIIFSTVNGSLYIYGQLLSDGYREIKKIIRNDGKTPILAQPPFDKYKKMIKCSM